MSDGLKSMQFLMSLNSFFLPTLFWSFLVHLLMMMHQRVKLQTATMTRVMNPQRVRSRHLEQIGIFRYLLGWSLLFLLELHMLVASWQGTNLGPTRHRKGNRVFFGSIEIWTRGSLCRTENIPMALTGSATRPGFKLFVLGNQSMSNPNFHFG